MAEKYAFRMRLNPGMKAEYRKRHDEIWPELVGAAARRPASPTIRSISTRRPTRCSACCGGATITRMADLPKHPVMQRWWAHMADIMETKPDNEPVAVPLETVFHME